jgi:hypothetical protein
VTRRDNVQNIAELSGQNIEARMSHHDHDRYRSAAEHHEHAANHYRRAETSGMAGDHIAAASHARTAHTYALQAFCYSSQAANSQDEHHGMNPAAVKAFDA